jgi:3',5'-cyclic AMP phosphodiesterase CpdA
MRGSQAVLGRFARPVADCPTRLAVLSDLHLSLSEHGTWRVSHRTRERLEAAVQAVNRLELDGVVFNGDLVQSGTKPQFDAFDRIVKRFDPPLFAVPGNHDLIDRGGTADSQLSLGEFERRYAPAEFPYRKRLGGIDLIGLNSNASTHESLTNSFEGRVETETLTWLGEALKDSDCPLVTVHHALEPVRDSYRRWKRDLPVENGGSPGFANAEALLDVLSTNGAPLVLTGHLHFPAVARTGSVHEFTLPSLGPFPSGFTVLDVDESGTTATFHSVVNTEEQVESLGYGVKHDRALIAAAQLATLPLVDES